MLLALYLIYDVEEAIIIVSLILMLWSLECDSLRASKRWSIYPLRMKLVMLLLIVYLISVVIWLLISLMGSIATAWL